MTENKLLYGVAGLLLGALLTWVLVVTVFNNQYTGFMGMMGIRNSTSFMSSNIDSHFIEQMIPHHDDAITMANLALNRAEHEEIKNLAQNIISAQTTENDQMRQWYKDWFNADLPENSLLGIGAHHGMHGGMGGGDLDIVDLSTADPFDKSFIEQMIPHHQMAIMMAQMLEASTTRPEMKKLAQDIIQAQASEIQQMRNWYVQWYGN